MYEFFINDEIVVIATHPLNAYYKNKPMPFAF